MMKAKRRRRSLIAFAVSTVVLGAIALVASLATHPEAVRQMWVTATINDSGTANITERIDYHFPSSRHGIYRIIPGLTPEEQQQVHVHSDTYSDLTLLSDPGGTRLRIGNPAHTVSGDHTYYIDYSLDTLRVPGGRIYSWNAVGTGWTVDVDRTEVDVVAPWRWTGLECDAGTGGSFNGCTVTQPEPGHLVVTHGKLHRGQGLTVTAQRGPDLAAAPAPRTPTGPPPESWVQTPAPAALTAMAGGLLGMLLLALLLRRAGRDWAGAGAASTGDAAGLAWNTAGAAPGSPSGAELVDDKVLASYATTEFAPPPGLTPWQGGVLDAEGVRNEHKVAWLVGAAVDGYVDLDQVDGKTFVMRAKQHELDATTAMLGTAFAYRPEVTLGTYDAPFGAMWKSLPSMFNGWMRGSGLWDSAGEQHVTTARLVGVLAAVLGIGGVIAFTVLAALTSLGMAALVGVALSAVVAGGGVSCVARSWELHRRTPAGSALWLRVESFRRFLANSEGFHAAEAAKRNVLREYTAWAVALGEVDHWSKAVAAAGLPPDTAGLQYAVMAPMLMSSTSHTAVAPSSSGGGGGGVGGGGGGGGGGSW